MLCVMHIRIGMMLSENRVQDGNKKCKQANKKTKDLNDK
jgi:hypothetical protein